MFDEPIRRYSRKPNPYLIPVVGGGVGVGLLSVIGALSLTLFNGGSTGKALVSPDGGVKQFAERLKATGAMLRSESVALLLCDHGVIGSGVAILLQSCCKL